MTGQLPLPLVPMETIPIGDAAGIYEDEPGPISFVNTQMEYFRMAISREHTYLAPTLVVVVLTGSPKTNPPDLDPRNWTTIM